MYARPGCHQIWRKQIKGDASSLLQGLEDPEGSPSSSRQLRVARASMAAASAADHSSTLTGALTMVVIDAVIA
jgi:hypothetical protein